MKFKTPIPITEIADRYNLQIKGDSSLIATGINEIHKVVPGDITFVDYEKYYGKSLNSAASIIIIDKEVDCPNHKALLICNDPFAVYDDIVRQHRPFRAINGQIHHSAIIDPSTIIECNVIIGPDVTIGTNCHIQAGSVIHEHVVIGNHVIIQSGAILGTDAFYFQKKEGKYKKWRSGGRVILEDHVDIGAGCTINRGVSGDTIIGEGSKLDSQVHIGHGAVVGKNCLIAAQTGIAGKSIIGDNVVLYGQVGISQNLTIGDNAVLLAKSGVSKSLKGDTVYFGYPADEMRRKYRELAALRNLPNFLNKKKK
ncbi:MAG: UDP-3-O-(3-hydroxymyristoyl)glucosamine N-acyltransferase [Bacteroidia bacterium]|nr:UDP-3-O-(3-hydroxymyristoyl)glucosamine N-acyltransferase [Bacteroidia bacterium]